MSEEQARVVIAATSWLMTDPPRPCPDVLTDEEAAVYLRLDINRSMKNALQALARYRAQGKIRAVISSRGQSSRAFVYRKTDLDQFLESQTTIS